MNTNESSLNIEDLNCAFGLEPGHIIYSVDENLINIITSSSANNEPIKESTLNTFNDFMNNDESANLLPFPHLEDSVDPMFASEHILHPSNSNILSNFSFSDVNFATSREEQSHISTNLHSNIVGSSFQIANSNSVEDTFEKVFTVRLKCKTCGESFDEDDHEARKQHFITKHFRPTITNSVSGTSLLASDKSNKSKSKSRAKHRKSFQCNWKDCSFRARMNSHLQEHYRIHTGERPFVCQWPGCGKTFQRNSTLKAHGSTHTGIKKYECTFPGCLSRFFKKFNLKAHMISHTDEKAFECNWPGCTMTFRRKQLLKNHIKTHMGEQDYVCDHPGCNFKTVYPTGLTRHKMTHTNLKNYACDYSGCDFVSRSTSDLKRHKAIHCKKFICNICDKSFARKVQLDKHNNSHH